MRFKPRQETRCTMVEETTCTRNYERIRELARHHSISAAAVKIIDDRGEFVENGNLETTCTAAAAAVVVVSGAAGVVRLRARRTFTEKERNGLLQLYSCYPICLSLVVCTKENGPTS